MAAMPPKLLADDERNIVIRPLAYCSERDIAKYARLQDFPIIPCNLCGSQENLQRQQIKEMLNHWEKESPGRINNIFRALQNVAPSQLGDSRLFDFESLAIDRSGQRDAGDVAGTETVREHAETVIEFFKSARLKT